MRKTRTMSGVMALAALSLLLGGCGSDPLVPNDDDELEVADLFGSWAWVSSQGGLTGGTITPATEGFEQTIVIEAPTSISLFRDGELVAATTFTFVAADPEDGEQLSTMFFQNPLLAFDSEFVGLDIEGNLVLADPCCDGFVHTFRRLVVE